MASYKHKSLPYGRDLCGEELKKDLNRVFEKHAKNADALSPNGSTCANESFNLLVASKAPKMHHYSKLESVDFRTASVVCQKNTGQTYMTDVNTAIGLSPGRISHKFSSQQEKVKLKKKEKSSSVQFKKTRLQLKESRRSSGSQQQLRKGVTYESSIGLENISVNNTTTIPAPTSLPESDIKKDTENWTVCYFNLETTGLSDDCEIVQVSAVDFAGLRLFDQYAYRNGSINFGSTKVASITKSSGKLFCHGKLVDAVEVNVGLNRFGLWLKELCGRVVLVGHNVRAFDVKHFWNNVKKWHLEDLFCSCIQGFVDTLPLFRNLFSEKHSHSQEKLYEDIVCKTYVAHNSVEDVIALSAIQKKKSECY